MEQKQTTRKSTPAKATARKAPAAKKAPATRKASPAKATAAKPAPKAAEVKPAAEPKVPTGHALITLRSPGQAAKAAQFVTVPSLKVDGPHVIVNGKDAQAVVDGALAEHAEAGEFDLRILNFVGARTLLAFPETTDPRSVGVLQQRLVAVGRQTEGFRLLLNERTQFDVFVGDRHLGTSRAALAELAPEQAKAPSTTGKAGEGDDTESAKARAAASQERYDRAKAQHKALKAWTEGGEQGDRPDTTDLDAMNGEYERKQQQEQAAAAERVAAKAKEVTPRPKATTSRSTRKAS